MRRLLVLILCAGLLVRGLDAAAGDADLLAPAGSTPQGDFDLEAQLDVIEASCLAGKVYLVQRGKGPSVGIEFREGRGPALFCEGTGLTARERGRRGPALARGRRLLVARRRGGPEGLASYALEVDGRLTDVLYAPAKGDREARYGGGTLRGGRLVRLEVRKVDEAFFDDEFTRDEEEQAGPWRPVEGDWDITTTRDAWVAVDRGPFATSSYRARPAEGKAALSLAEPGRMARMHVSVAVRLPEDAEAGIVFGATGADAGRALRALLVKPGRDGKGTARLVLRRGSKQRRIAGPARVYLRPGAWTRLEVWSDWDYVRAAVAGRVVLEADTAECPAGSAGLMALGRGGALFDDFRVRPWHVVHERRRGERMCWKESPAPGPDGSRVMTLLTPWPLRDFRLQVRAEKGTVFPVLAEGQAPWKVRPALKGMAGKALLPDGFWKLAPKGGPHALPAPLALDVSGPHAMAFADGRLLNEVTLEGLPDGRPAVLQGPGAVSARVVLEPSRRPFEADLFSSDFSVPAVKLPYGRGYVRVVGDLLRPSRGMWRCAGAGKESRLEARATGLALAWFHRPCPGDLRVEADLLSPAGGAFNQAGVVMAAGTDEAGKLSRYTLSVERLQGTELVLRRNAAKVAGAPVALDREATGAARLALERRGDRFFGYLGDGLVLTWRDADPLRGDYAGLFVMKGNAAFRRVSIRHLRGSTSSFRNVEPDWQPLSGEWRLHTGLMCIPWDHWITAFGSSKEPAYMGLLRPLSIARERRDVCVVARVSEAGEGYENRSHVHYPMHDVSITLRGRLEDPGRSGYRIVIAPLPGTNRIVLYRNGREVANEQGVIFVMGGHNNTPRDFNVVARAVGGKVSCSIGGTEFLSWTDPDPLHAGRVILGAEKGRVNFADVTVMDVSGSRRSR